MTSPDTASDAVPSWAMRCVWMPVLGALRMVPEKLEVRSEDGEEGDVAGLVSSARRPDTRWHPVVGGQRKHGRPSSEL